MDEEEHKDGCTLSHQPQSDGSTEQMRSTEKSSSNITPSNSSAQESNPSSAESSAVQTSISSTSDSKSHQPHTSPTSLSAYSASSSCPSFPSCQQSPSKIETIFQPITSFPAIAASSSPSGCTESVKSASGKGCRKAKPTKKKKQKKKRGKKKSMINDPMINSYAVRQSSKLINVFES